MSTGSSVEPRPVLRVVRRGLLALLVILLLLLAAGSWYFSGLIRADGLEVKEYAVEQDLALTPAADGTVRISSSDATESQMVNGPTTYGVEWDGGYGQVSGPVVSGRAVSGSVDSGGEPEVVRRFEVLTGEAPGEATPASLELGAFPDDPALSLGPRATEVTYTSPVGSLPAWYVPGSGADNSTWAILVHGKGGTRTEMYRMALSTIEQGLPTLDISYRNDVGLPRDPSDQYQYGRTEWRDLAGAVEYAAERGAERIVLGGDSMGGGIIAAYLRNTSGTSGSPEVVGTVLDAPMLDFAETVRFGARQLDLPVPGPARDLLTATALQLAAVRFDVDWDATDYLTDTDWLSVPTLVFHGTADTTVPISTSRQLAGAHPELVTLVETEGVEHVRSWNHDPEAYDKAVRAFIERL